MKGKIEKEVIDRIFERAQEIHYSCNEECRDFRIMVSPSWNPTLILRWLTIDLSNIDNPVQCFRYECFHPNGTPQNCSVHYANQGEANSFFADLQTLYRQEFSIDHKL